MKIFTEESIGNIIIVIYVPMAKREEKPVYLNDDILKILIAETGKVIIDVRSLK